MTNKLEPTSAHKVADLVAALRPVKTNFDLVRLGSVNDGGYLVPDDLEGIVACFSPGVANKADFELSMAERGVPCFMADYSVEAPPIKNPLFHFEKKFLGTVNAGEFITMEDWVARNAPKTGDMILQMDIEGAEYKVFPGVSQDTLKRFRIVVVEFHNVQEFFINQVFEARSTPFLQLLADFDVVHIHPNNCCGEVTRDGISIPRAMEFTFLRKDRITHKEYAGVFPHPLDVQCVLGKEDLVLPEFWIGANRPAIQTEVQPQH